MNNKVLRSVAKTLQKEVNLQGALMEKTGSFVGSRAIVGATEGIALGGAIGAIAGGINDDDTALKGAAKGALIGGAVSGGLSVLGSTALAKGFSSREDIRNAGKMLKGLNYDGIFEQSPDFLSFLEKQGETFENVLLSNNFQP